MSPGRYSTVTSIQREELWRRYKAGESVLKIASALGQRTSNLYRTLLATGGIEPALRTRSLRVLSFCEREEISRGIAAGNTLRAIARGLDRAVSTVSQEVGRHGGREGYRAAQADRAAWESARRPKTCLLARSRRLQRIVASKLTQDWSPQQIAGWLKDQYPGVPEMRVSHETIYRSLFVQARGALKKELIGHLRSKRGMRRPRHAVDGRMGERIADAVSISQRPAEVEDQPFQVTGKATWWKGLEAPSGLDPLKWTLHVHKRRGSRWRSHSRDIHRSFAARWWRCTGRDAGLMSWRRSLAARPGRSASGSSGRIGTMGAGMAD